MHADHMGLILSVSNNGNVSVCSVTHSTCVNSVPVRSIFDGLGGGCEVVAMSTDAKYVAMISTGSPQVSTQDNLHT